METNTKNRKFWYRYAKLYDAEVLRFSGRAYEEMYRSMGHALTKDMRVLEIATGTGLIAANIDGYVSSIEATDFSPKMIAQPLFFAVNNFVDKPLPTVIANDLI